MPPPGIEPGSTRPQRVVLTIILWKPTFFAIECFRRIFDNSLKGRFYELIRPISSFYAGKRCGIINPIANSLKRVR